MLELPESPYSRLAPTPSGYLHIGNAVSFLVTWALVRANKGKLWLRIDDLDRSRFRQEYLEDIFHTIDWLGIDYDHGPSGPDDFLRTHSQQHRIPYYQDALNQLWTQGDLYACTCTRSAIQTASKNGLYPGTCRDLSLPGDHPQSAWRIRIAADEAVSLKSWKRGAVVVHPAQSVGDAVLRRKDGLPAYQIASVIDDVAQGVNFIVRGEDLWGSSGIQLLLAARLGLPAFQETLFWHHGLLKDASGNKLSKSKGAIAIKSWREAGHSPVELYRMAGAWLGIEGPVRTAADLCTADR